MLTFFTDPFPNELIYSSLARYHYYNGNIEFKDTLEEVFGNRNVIPTLELCGHLGKLVERLGGVYSETLLIYKHTVFPYYSSFLSKDRQKEIIKDMNGDAKGLYTRIGFVAGSICNKEAIFYCPVCVQDDYESFGDCYIHREHQLQGINYCPHHFKLLRPYSIKRNDRSRIEYVKLRIQNIEKYKGDENEDTNRNLDYRDIECRLSKMAYDVMNLPFLSFSREVIMKKYKTLLQSKGYITLSGNVRQKELMNDFISKFPEGFLEKFNSSLDKNIEFNWLQNLTRNTKRHIHPIRHLLFMYFLGISVEEIVATDTEFYPFGKPPWPCLNKAADHYKEDIVTDVILTRDYSANDLVGTFKCECGYIYAKKGPDGRENDRYRVGSIKEFGEVWINKVNDLFKKGMSVHSISKVVGADWKTVNKYLNGYTKKISLERDEVNLIEKYRSDILEGKEIYMGYTRTQLRKLYEKQYIYLYRHDKEWLLKNLPQNNKAMFNKKRVDWEVRDSEYVREIEILYKELKKIGDYPRLTKGVVGRKLGILPKLENHIDKLPKTLEYLNKITETQDEYNLRRCYRAIDSLIDEGIKINFYSIRKKVSMRNEQFKQIESSLKYYIHKNYNMEII